MTTSEGETLSTIRGIAETVVALPYQLGYQPERSLVLICLDHHRTPTRRATGTVSLTARVDLAPPGEEDTAVAAVGAAIARVHPDVVLFIAFEGPQDDSSALLTRAADLAERRGAAVDRAVRVRDGSWIPMEEPDGSDPVWRTLPAAEDVPVVADYVLRGRRPLADRAELQQLLRTSRPLLTAAVGAELWVRSRSGTELGTSGAPETALALLGSVLRSTGVRLPDVAVSELTDLVLTSHDVLLRDAVLARLVPDVMPLADVPGELAEAVTRTLPGPEAVDEHSCGRLALLAGLAPEPLAAPLLTVCGYVAWAHGEGTLANVATERALQLDRGYSLAQLLDQALQHALPPPGHGRRGAAGHRGASDRTGRGRGSPAA